MLLSEPQHLGNVVYGWEHITDTRGIPPTEESNTQLAGFVIYWSSDTAEHDGDRKCSQSLSVIGE